jgi:DNA-binding response OmpR family regulator
MSDSHLLIIDDEPAMAKLIARIGASCGFQARSTDTADAFKDAYAALAPDVIVLDLAMPDEDGVELLRFLSDAGCSAEILIISGSDVRILQAARNLGEARGLRMAGTLAKPVRADDLRAALAATRGRAADRRTARRSA